MSALRMLSVTLGLAVLIYAAFVFAVATVPGASRRALRRRAGRCIGCGYRLIDDATPCPECGRESGSA